MRLPPLRETGSDTSENDACMANSLPPVKSAVPLKKKHSWKRLMLMAFLLLFFIIFVCLYLFPRPLLVFAGNLMVYESELTKSDVIVVLSGGGSNRLERAIELFQAGYAPRILLTLPETIQEDAAYHDLFVTEKTICEAILDLNKIPPEQVHWSGRALYSTYGEALFIRDWLKKNQYTSAIVVPGYFHSRRTKWAMDYASRGCELAYQIAPSGEDIYSVTEWWKNEEGIIMVENEYGKYVYYRLKGLIGHP